MWPPYYNGGVVITDNEEIPVRLLEYTRTLHNNDFTETNPDRETEQVALAVLAQEYETAELNINQNYMMGSTVAVPADVSVVHYLSLETFCTIRCPSLLDKLREVGVTLEPTGLDYISRVLGTVVFRGGAYFPRDWIRWYTRTVFPQSVRGDQMERVHVHQNSSPERKPSEVHEGG